MKYIFTKFFILFALIALFGGCSSIPKHMDGGDDDSEAFRNSMEAALQHADPDRRLDAIDAIPAKSEAEKFLKKQIMARVALTHKTDVFAAIAEPLIAAVNHKGYHETSDEAQVLARLGDIAADRTVDVTRRIAATVDEACSQHSVTSRRIDGTSREKGDSYIAEACFFLLKNNLNRSGNAELRALAFYEYAAVHEVLPAYITKSPAAGTPYAIQVLQGRLCDDLGVFCNALSLNSFTSSR